MLFQWGKGELEGEDSFPRILYQDLHFQVIAKEEQPTWLTQTQPVPAFPVPFTEIYIEVRSTATFEKVGTFTTANPNSTWRHARSVIGDAK
eukprot:6492131-Amphidinium_carterae.1